MWIEKPGEEPPTAADTAAFPAVVDTLYRPTPIDSAGASFAWATGRPPVLTSTRSFPDGPVEAVRQYLRALAQTGSGSRGTIGAGGEGYERAFTYVHPSVRRRRSAESWARELAGVVRPEAIRLARVPGDSTRVFAEVLVLRDVGGQSLLGLYYGHFTAARGDNGWQLTGARLASEDWQSPLGGHQPWRWDRAGAARTYAAEDSSFAIDLTRLESGEWVPLARPTPTVDLRLGLPEPR